MLWVQLTMRAQEGRAALAQLCHSLEQKVPYICTEPRVRALRALCQPESGGAATQKSDNEISSERALQKSNPRSHFLSTWNSPANLKKPKQWKQMGEMWDLHLSPPACQPVCRGVIHSCGWLKSLLSAGSSEISAASHSQGITGPCRIKLCLAMLTPCLEWRSNGEWTRTGCPPQSNAMTERKRLTKTKRKNAQGKNRKRSQVGRHSCEQRAGTVRCA